MSDPSPLRPMHSLRDAAAKPGSEATTDVVGAATADESTTTATAAVVAHQGPDFEEEYQAAVSAGSIPNSALAKQVFLNWKRFPDCIVLTRVGKFYEVSDDTGVEGASHSNSLYQLVYSGDRKSR